MKPIKDIYKIEHIKDFFGFTIGFNYFINEKLVDSVIFINGNFYKRIDLKIT